jgi:hypothetical protein
MAAHPPSASGDNRMQRVMTAVIAMLALQGGVAEAQQPPGYGPPYYPPYYGPYRPQEPNNARGVPPTPLPHAQPIRPPAGALVPPPAAAPTPSPATAAKTAPLPGPEAQTTTPMPKAQAPVSAPVPATPPAPAPVAAPPGAYPYGAYPGWPAGPYATPPQAAPYATQPYAAANASPWGQPAPPPAPRSPHLEVELSERQPYVQEHVLLRLKVVSEQGLTKATPELPSGNDLILQQLEDEPKVSTRTAADGRREILTEYVFILTPLRVGDLILPTLRVTGEMAGDAYGASPGQRFEASSGEGPRLQVRPALTSVQPWLPLRALSLKASLEGEDSKAGEPVSLILELAAIGATGSQLPSLESYLESPDFRVYREQTLTETKVSADGQRLEGKRTEHYTLVLHANGRLRLPEIRLPWWNVTTGSRDWVSLPVRLGGNLAEEGGAASRRESSDSGLGWLWLSLSSLLLPLIGFGLGLRYRGRRGASLDREPLGTRLGRGARAAADLAMRRLIRVRHRLHPVPVLRRLRQALHGLLPASSRFLFGLRAANWEQQPALWARRFQVEACRHLPAEVETLPAASLPGLAGQILRLRPGADPIQIQRLLRQLDGALYGGQDIDFRRWKRDFARQVGRAQGLFRFRGRTPRLERPHLPALNPRAAG